jgi:hypothetical protein
MCSEPTPPPVLSVSFFHPTESLYVDEPYGNASMVSVLSTSTMQKVGQLPDIFIQGVPTTIEEIGANSNLAGINNRGVTFLDASHPNSTASKAFQYLTSSQIYPNPGLHKFIAYDQSRQHLYLTATDHVDVFDLNASGYISPIEPPPNGPPPDAGLRGVTLTPDSSQVIIADFGAQSVYLVDPDGAQYNGTVVSVGGVAGFSSLRSGSRRCNKHAIRLRQPQR